MALGPTRRFREAVEPALRAMRSIEYREGTPGSVQSIVRPAPDTFTQAVSFELPGHWAFYYRNVPGAWTIADRDKPLVTALGYTNGVPHDDDPSATAPEGWFCPTAVKGCLVAAIHYRELGGFVDDFLKFPLKEAFVLDKTPPEIRLEDLRTFRFFPNPLNQLVNLHFFINDNTQPDDGYADNSGSVRPQLVIFNPSSITRFVQE